MLTMFHILTHDCCISFYILPLKCETCFPRFKQSSSRRSHLDRTLGTSCNQTYLHSEKEKARGRREERKRDHGRSLEKRFPEWCGFLRFTTFLIVWNSLSTANKERKMSPSPHFHLDRFHEHCVTARSVAREHPGGDGILSLQRQQFPSTFLLFNYTVVAGVRNGEERCSSPLSPRHSPRTYSIRPIFVVPSITEIACLSLVFTLVLRLPSSRLS